MEGNERRRKGPALAFIGLAAGLLASSLTVWSASQAAFSATTTNPGNGIGAGGTITLSDNDSSTAMFSTTDYISSARSATKCIAVSYGGNIPAATPVQLYSNGTPTASGALTTADVLVTITKGAGVTDPYSGCTNFTADATANAYTYSGTLASFLTKCAAWNATPDVACDTKWTAQNGDTESFKFTMVLDPAVANNREGQTITNIPLVWEARS